MSDKGFRRFHFSGVTLEGEAVEFELEDIGTICREDGVVYVFGAPVDAESIEVIPEEEAAS